MMTVQNVSYKKYIFEFLSIFVGITLAFALENWSSYNKDRHQEYKILIEIRNGLELDLHDLKQNMLGHERGLNSAKVIDRFVLGKTVGLDTLNTAFKSLTRDYIAVQNKTGYESLKSQGLELIEDDSLRFAIIKLYDFNYQIIGKLEENYEEEQFFKNYEMRIFDPLFDYIQLDDNKNIIAIKNIGRMDESTQTKTRFYIDKLEHNRRFIYTLYDETHHYVEALIRIIDKKISK